MAVNLIIEVRGGTVVEVYSDQADANVVIVDWDNQHQPNTGNPLRFSPASFASLPKETARVASSSFEQRS